MMKPFDFVSRGKRGFIPTAIKCQGSEYLRNIYAPLIFEDGTSQPPARMEYVDEAQHGDSGVGA